MFGVSTWTPKICRIMALYRFWAIILPIFGGVQVDVWGSGLQGFIVQGLGFWAFRLRSSCAHGFPLCTKLQVMMSRQLGLGFRVEYSGFERKRVSSFMP